MKFLGFNFAAMFYIRKIKDEHRIMSQATNKEIGFSSQQHFQLLQCLMPHRFYCIKAKHIDLKLKLNLTSAAFGSAKNHMCMRFRKTFVICLHNLRFCVAILCGCGETKSPCKSYEGKRSSEKGKY